MAKAADSGSWGWEVDKVGRRFGAVWAAGEAVGFDPSRVVGAAESYQRIVVVLECQSGVDVATA